MPTERRRSLGSIARPGCWEAIRLLGKDEIAGQCKETRLEKEHKAVGRPNSRQGEEVSRRNLNARLEKVSKVVARPSDVQGGRGR